MERVHVLVGDLAQSELGLAQGTLAALARCGRLRAVVHNGAVVHSFLAYGQLKAANVGAAMLLAKLADAAADCSLHFVSSCGILGGFDGTAPDVPPPVHGSGYTCSKWISDQFVLATVPSAAVYRLGNVAGGVSVGRGNADDAIMQFVRFLLLVRCVCAPLCPAAFCLLPADECARTLAAAVAPGRPPAARVHHMPGDMQFSLAQLLDVLREAGHPVQAVPEDDFRAAVHGLRPGDPMFHFKSMLLAGGGSAPGISAAPLSPRTHAYLLRVLQDLLQ